MYEMKLKHTIYLADYNTRDLELIVEKTKKFLSEVKFGDLTFKKQDGKLVLSEITEREKY